MSPTEVGVVIPVDIGSLGYCPGDTLRRAYALANSELDRYHAVAVVYYWERSVLPGQWEEVSLGMMLDIVAGDPRARATRLHLVVRGIIG